MHAASSIQTYLTDFVPFSTTPNSSEAKTKKKVIQIVLLYAITVT